LAVEILDAQLHCWEADIPSRPWLSTYRDDLKARALNVLIQTGVPMPPQTLLVSMATAGVDGGVLTPQGVYGNDNSLELKAALDYPRKFVVIGWVDHAAPDVADVIEREASQGMVGIRLLRMPADAIDRGDFDAVLAICEQRGLAVTTVLPHPVPPQLEQVFAKYAGVNFLIDHLGVGHAPPALGLAPVDPFELLPAVLRLSAHANVSVKLTGAAALSSEAFPFQDIWPGVLRLIEAYGPERVVWGSDITRTGSLHTYAESTHFLREVPGLSNADLAQIYGQSLRKILGWGHDDYLMRYPARSRALPGCASSSSR
jgi:L-fuconolactonase